MEENKLRDFFKEYKEVRIVPSPAYKSLLCKTAFEQLNHHQDQCNFRFIAHRTYFHNFKHSENHSLVLVCPGGRNDTIGKIFTDLRKSGKKITHIVLSEEEFGGRLTVNEGYHYYLKADVYGVEDGQV